MNSIPEPLQQIDRTLVRFKGRKLAYFAGCDYFRMASDARVLKAAANAIGKFGLNVSASRLTTGNHKLYGELEAAAAKFFGAESATLAANGYAPNLMVAQAWTGKFSHAVLDERAHGALVDAALLMGCPLVRFKHRDAGDLKRVLKGLGKPIVMTDGMFSHDGGIAPLKEYFKLLPTNGWLWVDDAHGAGILGAKGRGSVELAGLSRERVVQTVTLSKAFGVYGGAVIGTQELRDEIVARSRVFVGNTPLPLPLAAAALKSVEIVSREGAAMRRRLAQNVERVRRGLGEQAAGSTGPIVPIVPGSSVEKKRMEKRLLQKGIFPSFIRYPGGPENGYFRFVISSEHSRQQLDALVEALLG